MRDLSILIPSRNEKYLRHTIEDILKAIEVDTEIIAVCDGALPVEPIDDHPRVKLVLLPKSIGQRAATNLAARMSTAKYIMKLDAHCRVEPGFDAKLMEDCEPDWTVVPRMYNLHVFDWQCRGCGYRSYMGPVPKQCEKCKENPGFDEVLVWKPRLHKLTTSYCFDNTLHFQYFGDYTKRLRRARDHSLLTDTMSLLGACWFLERKRYWELGGLDERHTSWGQMGTEIACATWLTGGRLVVNQKTWFSHMFRTQEGFSFPYPMDGRGQRHARSHSRWLWVEGNYPKMIRPLSSLVEQFAPVPSWTEEALDNLKKIESKKWPVTFGSAAVPAPAIVKPKEAGIIYYTDGLLADPIMEACQKQLARAANGHRIINVSLGKAIPFGDENIIIERQRSAKSLFLQIIAGLERSTADYVFFCEHDCLYPKEHFQFVPRREDTFYYNTSMYRVSAVDGRAVTYLTQQLSGLCANRLLLLEHYYRRLAYMALRVREIKARGDVVEHEGHDRFAGWEPGSNNAKENHKIDQYGLETFKSSVPYLDIRDHGTNWTWTRWKTSHFKDKSTCMGWTEVRDGEIPGWGKIYKRFEAFIADIANAN